MEILADGCCGHDFKCTKQIELITNALALIGAVYFFALKSPSTVLSVTGKKDLADSRFPAPNHSRINTKMHYRFPIALVPNLRAADLNPSFSCCMP